MIRILEILVSLVIVFLLAVVVGVFLPDHAHIERTIEVSNPLRQIYDTLNTFRRYPEYSSLRKLDPRTNYTFSGAESGPDAKIAWKTAYEQLGDGSLTIKSSTEDSEIKMAAENGWYGENKMYTATLLPAANGKTTRIRMAYDVDYGWNLLWRYAGLYIHGVPDSLIQSSLANLSNMLASFPNVDYKDQPMQVVDVTSVPMLLVSTKAKRSLEDVEVASDAALVEIEEVMKKAGLERAGPPRTITTE
ncbi:MAG: polyketide cyclase, partial [Dokdonella sp.]